ncbi:MAG: hypothetical protein AAF587_00260 [Bacteroidota bacterium]
MKQLISLILVLAGLGLGYLGYTKMQDSSNSLKIAGIELKAQDSAAKNESYLMLGGGALCLILGVVALTKGKK